MDTNTFGNYLRKLRKNKRLTLVELSNLSGVSNPYLSQIENDKFTPSPDILRKLADPLGLDYINLLSAAGYVDELSLELEIRQAQELVKGMPSTRDGQLNPNDRNEEKHKSTKLMNLYFDSVVTWSADQLFNENETIIIREHFSETLLRYKKLIEVFSNSNRKWESSKEDYYGKFTEKLTEQGIEEMYLKIELEKTIQDLNDWVNAFPGWIARHKKNEKEM